MPEYKRTIAIVLVGCACTAVPDAEARSRVPLKEREAKRFLRQADLRVVTPGKCVTRRRRRCMRWMHGVVTVGGACVGNARTFKFSDGGYDSRIPDLFCPR